MGLFEVADKEHDIRSTRWESCLLICRFKLLRAAGAGNRIRLVPVNQSKWMCVWLPLQTGIWLEMMREKRPSGQTCFTAWTFFPFQFRRCRNRKNDLFRLQSSFLPIWTKIWNGKKTYRRGKDVLLDYRWPGNVRGDLKNVVERSMIMSNTNEVTLETCFLHVASVEGRSFTKWGKESI